MLDHLPALVALTCPSYLSYDRCAQRLVLVDRVLGVRQPRGRAPDRFPFRGRRHDSANAELKACDASSNPHLALGGLILAGLDGLRRGLQLPEPATHDPATLPDERPLPADQLAALAELEADPVLMDGLGDLLGRCVLATRRAEHASCIRMGDEAVRAVTFDVL